MMRIVFMGTPDFSAQVLQRLLISSHQVIAVVTQPDRPRGRGQKVIVSPVKEMALAQGLPLLQPASFKTSTAIEEIKKFAPDLIITAAYGHILPASLLAVPSRAAINVHASLLPKYRGAAPINWALMNGEKETGISIMYMASKMDAGDVLLRQAIPIGEDDDAVSLTAKLSVLGGELLPGVLDRLEAGTITSHPQDSTAVTYAPMLKKELGLIEWQRPARDLFNQIRALKPWPHAYTYLQGERIVLHSARVLEEKASSPPGCVVAVSSQAVLVACGDKILALTELQREGKKCLPAVDFSRGCHLKTGIILGLTGNIILH